jgi:hypothetical protein
LNHVKPKVHVYGHFHLESGMMEKWGIKFINATSCNEAYLIANDPIEVEIADNGNMDEVEFC